MDSVELGQQVLAKRKEKRMSQSELGALAGITRNYVSQIEHGVAKNLSMNLIAHLAVALGTSIAELAGEASHITIPNSLRDFGIANNLPYEIVDKLARIPKRGKEPKSIEEWQALYHAIMPFIEGDC